MKPQFIRHFLASILLFTAVVLLAACQDAPLVDPGLLSTQGQTTGSSGTTSLQVQQIYPAGATDAPIDTDVVIVFTKPIDNSVMTTVNSNITVTGNPARTTTVSTDKRVVTLNFTSNLSASTPYTVTVNTGITDESGNALEALTTGNFTTGTDTSALYDPDVIAVVPSGTGVSIDQSLVTVYFSKDMNPATIDSTSFDILDSVPASVATAAPVQIDARTYCRSIGSLVYAASYTVRLTAAIADMDGNTLTLYTTPFTVESDPSSAFPQSVTSQITDVTINSATITWVTANPADAGDTFVRYGNSTSYGNSVPEGVSGSMATVHTKTISGLSSATRYFYEIRIGGVSYSSGSLITRDDAGTSDDQTLDTNGTDNSLITAVQSLNLSATTGLPAATGTSYAIWKRSNNTVYAQYFNTAASVLWTANGVRVHNAAVSDIRGFSDGTGGVLVTFDTGSAFGLKHFYDVSGTRTFNAGNSTIAGWTGVNTDTGTGILFNSGTYTRPSVAITYTGVTNNIYQGHVTKVTPASGVITPLTTEMENYNSGTNNLVFDRDLNFTAVTGLSTGDYILTGFNYGTSGSTFTSERSAISFLTGGFNYTVNTTRDLASGTAYALIDSASTSATADGNTVWPDYPSTNPAGTIYTTTDMSGFAAGDIVVSDTGDYYAYLTANPVEDTSLFDGNSFYGCWRLNLSTGIGVNNSDTFKVYERLEGQIGTTGTARAVEAKTNALWDNDAAFGSVAANDIILREYDSTIPSNANITTVSTINNTKALTLAANIMNDNQDYWIVRTAGGGTANILAFGSRDSGSAVNVLADTSGQGYGNISNAVVGDIVYNVTRNTYAAVTTDNGTSLTLSRNIVSATTDTDTYMVLASNESILDLGSTTSAGTAQLIDANASFVAGGIQAGDILYYDSTGAGAYTAIRITGVSATTLTLPTGSNTAISRAYCIIQPRVLVAWESGGTVLAQYLNLRDGSDSTGEITVDSTGSMTNVNVLADGSGNAFIVYQNATTMYAKKLDAIGTGSASAATSLGAGVIKSVKSDGAGGMYVLSLNGTTVTLQRRSSTLTSTWSQAITATGKDPCMTVDPSGNPIVGWATSTNNVLIQKRALATGATDVSFDEDVTGTLQSYVSSLSAVSTGDGGAILSWTDKRYYSTLGYIVTAQAFANDGASQWNSNIAGTDYTGIKISIPGTYDSSDLELKLLYYDNPAMAPFNGLFLWRDYRNSRSDIYFDIKTY